MKIEGEKTLERKLNKAIKDLGGESIKLLATHHNGLPDRLCLLPGGIAFFAEIKTTTKKPKPIQVLVHKRIRRFNFEVFVIETSGDIIRALDKMIL